MFVSPFGFCFKIAVVQI